MPLVYDFHIFYMLILHLYFYYFLIPKGWAIASKARMWQSTVSTIQRNADS